MTQQQSIQQLVDAIHRYNELYRLGKPEISDAGYDKLVDDLRAIDPENEWFYKPEPVTVKAGRKLKLPIPMKSLNKVKGIAELKQWIKSLALPDNARLVITPKYDGVSWLRDEVSGITYSRGGSENEGQDCSSHFLAGGFKPLPSSDSKLPVHCTFGELVFSVNGWEDNFAGRVSPSSGEKYKSPRNTVAGFINRDEAPEEIRFAEFVRYGVDESSLGYRSTYTEVLKDICNVFGQLALLRTVRVSKLSEKMLAELFAEWRQLYYIDGLVIYMDDLILWDMVGRHQTSGNPLYAIAYKHPDFTEAFATTVKGISWKVSKSGALKPVVNIEAVDTGDCNMENPTGYNAGWVSNANIASGAKILVTRSGGVIPKILETITSAPLSSIEELWDSVALCPNCGAPTMWDDTMTELYCVNPACSGVKLAKIVFFYTTIGCENMGEETLAKIFGAGYTSVRDILNISLEELVAIDGFGDGIANTVIENNRRIMEGIDLATLMHASDCFKGIGRIKAQKILDDMTPEKFGSFLTGRVDLLMPPEGELEKLSKTMQSFLKGIKPFRRFLDDTKIPFRYIAADDRSDGKLNGWSVCFSGVRDKRLEEEITKHGGRVVSGVSKNTTHLVVKDTEGTSSKIEKARELGIPILTLEDFAAHL